MTSRIAFFLSVALLAFGMESAFALEIALIGDKSRRDALQQIAQEMRASPQQSSGVLRVSSTDGKMTFSVTESSDDPVAIANQLLSADVAFLLVDSTQGPRPVVREQLIVSRQARIPRVVIVFSNTRALQAAAPKDAAELLELEEMEMRELLNKYEMDGDRATVLFDSDVSRVYNSQFSKGPIDRFRFLSSYSSRRSPRSGLRPVSEFNCFYYLLSNPEAGGRGVTLADRSEIEVWVEGGAATAIVQSSTSHKPGDNGEFVLHLSTPLKAVEGSRVLLVRNRAAVGMGVVRNVVR